MPIDFSDFKVYIADDFSRFMPLAVYLVRENAKGVYATLSVGEGGELIETPYGFDEAGNSLQKPFMRCNKAILQALVDAVSEQVHPVKKEVADAELKATKFHLEDMRKLVFNKNETN